ncbi:MAG: hypothetical protein U9N57_01230 [Pseudomonadota bacterium]|nr:hypothetical protein [Pseudomonadota bacterium]
MSDSTFKKAKDNLAKIPAKSWKVMATVLVIPIVVFIFIVYSVVVGDKNSSKTQQEKGEVYLGSGQNSGVVTTKKEVSSEYMETLKAEEKKQESEVLSGKTTHGAFIATPDVFDVDDTGFKAEDFDTEKVESFEPKTSIDEPKPEPKTPIDEPKVEPKTPIDEPKPEPKTPIDEPKSSNAKAPQTAINQSQSQYQPMSDAEKALQAAYKEELGRVFNYVQTITQKDTEMVQMAATSSWKQTYSETHSSGDKLEKPATIQSASGTSKSYGENRDKVGIPILLPGDRLISEVVGNVNSDRPSKIVFRVNQGALSGAEIIGNYKAQKDVPVIELSTITWKGHTGVIRGVATDPMNNNNYVTGDVNYHTISRWTALAASYLVKGFSAALSVSGTTISKDINGNETTATPEYTTEELWIQAGGALANKGADIAGAYFGTPPTVKLHDGDVFGILIFEAMDYDWLPPIKKGTDVL